MDHHMDHSPVKTMVSFSEVFMNTGNKVHRVTKEADEIEI